MIKWTPNTKSSLANQGNEIVVFGCFCYDQSFFIDYKNVKKDDKCIFKWPPETKPLKHNNVWSYKNNTIYSCIVLFSSYMYTNGTNGMNFACKLGTKSHPPTINHRHVHNEDQWTAPLRMRVLQVKLIKKNRWLFMLQLWFLIPPL